MNDKYGLRIYNYDAASIYSFKKGTKEKYEKTNALLANSLFCDFLKEKVIKRCTLKNKKEGGEAEWVTDKDGAWTRDIVCVDFSSGVKNDKREIIIGVSELRKVFYKNGFSIVYPDKEISYKMLYRSGGKAKKGSCMFINEKLYEKAFNFLRMGSPKLLEENSRLVELSAYQSLVASAIVGKVKINPKNILVINDIDKPFKRDVVAVSSLLKKFLGIEISSSKNCANQMKNTLFDGQSLIDISVFKKCDMEEDKPNGFILLRQLFFKSAAFCAKIKLFFEDYCSEYGLDYEKFTVKDVWGREHFAKDIELITTENSMKWMKFGGGADDFELWSEKVSENGNLFGIVKTAHPSRQGEFQRMSYQMVNALENDPHMLAQAAQCSYDYVEKLKKSDDEFLADKSKNIDDNEFIGYLKKHATYCNDYDVLYEICKKNRQFLRCDYFRERKRKIISEYVSDLKAGRIIQNGDNLVIVGSPYAMLLAAAGEDVSNDKMFKLKKGEDAAVQCYTERFPDGAELAEFRNPFNGRNNLGYMRNMYPPEKIRKYFKRFGKQIVAVNMIGTDFQARNNGSDQDSDFIFTTDEPSIVACAKKFYKEYPTIINDIPEEKACQSVQPDYAGIDNKLFNAKNQTGTASNLAQRCLTYSYNFPKEKERFEAYVCILSVLAQIAIDEAKHNFDIKAGAVISEIQQKIDAENLGFPLFWRIVWDRSDKRLGDNDDESKKAKRAKKIVAGARLACPMNYIYAKDYPDARGNPTKELSIDKFFVKNTEAGEAPSRTAKKSELVADLISEFGLEFKKAKLDGDDDDDSELLLRAEFEEMVEEIKRRRNVTPALCSVLIDKAFKITPPSDKKKEKDNRPLLLQTLASVNMAAVLACFKSEAEM